MKRHIITSVVALSILGVSVSFAGSGDKPKKQQEQRPPENAAMMKPQKEKSEVYLSLDVTHATLKDHVTKITGFGEVSPKYELNYTAEVSGRVTYVNDSLDTGGYLKKNDTLIKIDNTKYKASLTAAELSMAEAKVALLEEERESEQALIEWESSGLKGKPDSELVLRKPQLNKAKLSYQQSKDNYKSAKYDYDNTIVKSPFDSFVVDRSVQLGSYIQTGTTIATIYNSDTFEVEVPISQSKWKNLTSITGSEVKLSDKISQNTWIGKLVRTSKNIDPETRQRSVFVSIEKPMEKGLFSGTFVKAELSGQTIENVWEIPQTAIANKLATKSEIYIVDRSNKLKLIEVKEVYQENDSVFVKPLSNIEYAEVVNKPLVSYKEGMLVKITNTEGEK